MEYLDLYAPRWLVRPLPVTRGAEVCFLIVGRDLEQRWVLCAFLDVCKFTDNALRISLDNEVKFLVNPQGSFQFGVCHFPFIAGAAVDCLRAKLLAGSVFLNGAGIAIEVLHCEDGSITRRELYIRMPLAHEQIGDLGIEINNNRATE